MDILHDGVDFLDDKVRNRAISVAILIAVIAPVLRWMLFFYVSQVDNPLMLFLLYACIAILGYLALIPLGIGNSVHICNSEKASKNTAIGIICVSIVSCLALAIYTFSFVIGYITQQYTFRSNWWYLFLKFFYA